ncbi:Pre-rRNA-processing protein TSR2 conserved region [Euphorbia peplus]|nr:Pre-rRNA-processing protein TSR2 conserved region [Euphorbia peplus]
MSGPTKQLPTESIPLFQEGIYLILSRWSALQLAIENEWAGRDSHLKAQDLATSIFSWFTHSKEPLYLDDLENILDEGMLSLNTMIEDGSIEEVAEKLMIMHEECLEGDYNSIEKLRQAVPRTGGHQQVTNDDHDDDEDDDDDDEDDSRGDNSSNMMVDAPQSLPILSSQPKLQVDKPSTLEQAQEEDGWTTVSSSRKTRGMNYSRKELSQCKGCSTFCTQNTAMGRPGNFRVRVVWKSCRVTKP